MDKDTAEEMGRSRKFSLICGNRIKKKDSISIKQVFYEVVKAE